jgi:3-methyladenine DNA glycosylase AlkC
MTRKKWNRLRRQRPELFYGFANTCWERMNPKARWWIVRQSKRDMIARLTSFTLNDKKRLPEWE